MTDRETQYRGILANPFDSLARLVYADRLEEEGEPERAEFIRLQHEIPAHACAKLKPHAAHLVAPVCRGCVELDAMRKRERHLLLRHCLKWVPAGWEVITSDMWAPAKSGQKWPAVRFHRGFASEVRCSLGWWQGGRCDDCVGSGEPYEPHPTCSPCRGTGRTPAHGYEVVARHPITTVVVPGLEPDRIGRRWCWVRNRSLIDGQSGVLPAEVFDALRGGELEEAGGTWGNRGDQWRIYLTCDAAVEALSIALVDLARVSAGLPPLTWEP